MSMSLGVVLMIGMTLFARIKVIVLRVSQAANVSREEKKDDITGDAIGTVHEPQQKMLI
jgi:hypothetical protein